MKGPSIDDVVKLIRGPEGSKVRLRVRHPGEQGTKEVVVTRRTIKPGS